MGPGRQRRTVVVTGGTGMDRAVADGFVADGARVVVVGRRPEPLDAVVRGHGSDAVTAVVADLTDADDAQRVADALAGTTVDGLVNNAGGVGGAPAPGLHGRLEPWRRVLDQNLLSAMLLTEALWSTLTRNGGRIVSVGSIAGQHGGGGAYGAAKAGLVAWSAELAARGGADGITVNVVAPGYVQDTEFFDTSGRSARHDALVGQTLVGRAGTPADVAAAVVYLAGPDAGYVTGQVLSVNGGCVPGSLRTQGLSAGVEAGRLAIVLPSRPPSAE